MASTKPSTTRPSRLRRGETRAVIRSFMAHHQGMSLLSLGLCAARPSHAAALRRRTRCSRRPCCFCRSAFPGRPRAIPHAAESSSLREPPRRVSEDADARLHRPRHAGARSAAAVQRPLPRDGHQRRRRIQPLEGPRGHALARGHHVRPLGHILLPARYRRAASSGRPRISPRCSASEALRGDFLRGARANSAAATTTSIRIPRSRSRPKTTSSCAASPSPIARARARTIEVTSYAEVVLAPPAADARHPAFSNLFVQTEILADAQAILCTRRPRSADEPAAVDVPPDGGAWRGRSETSYETDRAQFIGRGETVAAPARDARSGAALRTPRVRCSIPIVAIRARVTIDPEQSATIDIVTGVGRNSRRRAWRWSKNIRTRAWPIASSIWRGRTARCAAPAQRHRSRCAALRPPGRLGALRQRLAARRPRASCATTVAANPACGATRSPATCRSCCCRSPTRPISIWCASSCRRMHIGGMKGLAVDLVIWNEDRSATARLQDQIMGLIAAAVEANMLDRPGGIFVRAAEQISAEDRILLQTVARVIVSDTTRNAGGADRSGAQDRRAAVPRAGAAPNRAARAASPPSRRRARSALRQRPRRVHPRRPRIRHHHWRRDVQRPRPGSTCSPIPQFGTRDLGKRAAYTWSENAHEFRLTPWHNDPVSDASGEAFYLRDEESGPVLVAHAAARARQRRLRHPARIRLQRLRAHRGRHRVRAVGLRGDRCAGQVRGAASCATMSGRPRRLSATGYVEWVLGDLRAKTAMHVTTEVDPDSGALLARNPYNSEFAERVAFFDVDEVDAHA